VIYPGGFGTLDELFEAVTLVQTGKAAKFPIVLVGKDYWGGLIDWLQNTMMASGCVDRHELELITLVDNADEAARIIIDRHHEHPEVIGGGF
jgi:hypothetical protein